MPSLRVEHLPQVLVRAADESIKPGVERSGTPGDHELNISKAREAGDRPQSKRLPPAPRPTSSLDAYLGFRCASPEALSAARSAGWMSKAMMIECWLRNSGLPGRCCERAVALLDREV
jgi:hypothetical protein